MKQTVISRKAFGIPLACATFLLSELVLGIPQASFAQTSSSVVVQGGAPRTLSYQGAVTNHGIPIPDGVHPVTVTLYTDESGGRSIWSASYSPMFSNGVFNVALGSDKPLPEAAAMDRPLWVGVKLETGAEMKPLTPLSSSPYAVNVANNSVTSAKLVDGAVTAAKIGADFIGSISVNGTKVSSKGGDINFVGGNGMDLAFDPGTGSVLVNPPAVSGHSQKGEQPLTPNPGFKFWGEGGNFGTNPLNCGMGVHYIGTSDATDLSIATGDATPTPTERIHITSGVAAGQGMVGINTCTPTEELTVAGRMASLINLGDPGGPNFIRQKGEVDADNVDLAWGAIPPVDPLAIPPHWGLQLPGVLTGFSFVGVAAPFPAMPAPFWTAPNVCTITLPYPSTPTPGNPSLGGFIAGEYAVVATVIEDVEAYSDPFSIPPTPAVNTPGFATVTLAGNIVPGPNGLPANQFQVKTYGFVGGVLTPMPLPFTFRVVGR